MPAERRIIGGLLGWMVLWAATTAPLASAEDAEEPQPPPVVESTGDTAPPSDGTDYPGQPADPSAREAEGKESTRVLRPKSVGEVPASDSNEPGRLNWGVSVLGTTPLIKENDFDARFRAFGAVALVSIPLTEIGHRLYLHVEGGFGASFSLIEPATDPAYNHTFFDFPIRLRLFYPLNDDGIAGEVYVGGLLRFFQYNDNPLLLDGPYFPVISDIFQPDFAVGLAVPVTRNLRARLLAGYLYLALGLELTFDRNP